MSSIITVRYAAYLRFGVGDEERDPLIDVRLGKSFGVISRVPEHFAHEFSDLNELIRVVTVIGHLARAITTGVFEETQKNEVLKFFCDCKNEMQSDNQFNAKTNFPEMQKTFAALTPAVLIELFRQALDEIPVLHCLRKTDPDTIIHRELIKLLAKCDSSIAGDDAQKIFTSHMILFDFLVFEYPKPSGLTHIAYAFIQHYLTRRMRPLNPSQETAMVNIGYNRFFMIYYNWIAVNTHAYVKHFVMPLVGQFIASLDETTFRYLSNLVRRIYWADKPRLVQSSINLLPWPDARLSIDKMTDWLFKIVPHIGTKNAQSIQTHQTEYNRFCEEFGAKLVDWLDNKSDTLSRFVHHSTAFKTTALYAAYILLCVRDFERLNNNVVERIIDGSFFGPLTDVELNDFWMQAVSTQLFGLMTTANTFDLIAKCIVVAKLSATIDADGSVWTNIINSNCTQRLLNLVAPLSASDNENCAAQSGDANEELGWKVKSSVTELLSILKKSPTIKKSIV